MTDPHTQNPTAATSAAEAELARLEARRVELLAQVQSEREARDAAAPQLRRLAIRMHQVMCMEVHNGTGSCAWYSDVHADDAEAADWTRLEGHRWLLVAHAGVWCAQDEGWTVTPPALPEAP